MKKLNINRLIGGGVLFFAALLFIPPIINSNSQSQYIDKSKYLAKNKPKIIINKKPNNKTDKLELRSFTSKVNNTIKKNNNIPTKIEKSSKSDNNKIEKKSLPIKMESLDKTIIVNKTKKNNGNKKQEKWIRVGSFSNLANADKLEKELKHLKYSVKIENTEVYGKNYRRIMVGPFFSDKDIQKVMEQIKLKGLAPNTQR